MPPPRDPNRLFYDAVNPVMLSHDEVMQLSPAEVQSATDQLDQNLVLLLQRVEENFARCNEIVTERILASFEVHGENTQRINQSVKFWRPFFEAAANIRLNEAYAEQEPSVAADEPSEATIHPDRTISDEGDVSYGTAPSVGGTPRAPQQSFSESASSGAPVEPHWSSEGMSPFNPGPPPAVGGADYSAQRPLPDVQRLRLRDLPPDSPDFAEPQFETIHGGLMGAASRGGRAGADTSRSDAGDMSKQSTEPSFLRGSPTSRHDVGRAPPPAPQSALLNKVLRKGLGGTPATASRPGQSTPGHGKIKYPHDLPSNWDGIANLSTTTLDAFPSPIKRRGHASMLQVGDDSLYGPPPSTAASARTALISSPAGAAAAGPSSSRDALNASTSTLRRFGTSPAPQRNAAFSRTPAKEAARRTVQNVYDALGDLGDSPALELPSALRNPARTMSYNYYASTSAHGAGAGPGSPSEKATARRADRTLLGDEAAAAASGAANDESYASMPSQPSFMTQPIPFSHHAPYDASGASLSLSGAHGDDAPLADFGGGTTANIDALLAGNHGGADQYAGIVDDDDHDGAARFGSGTGGTDESFTGEADDHLHLHHRPAEPTYTEGFDEGYSRDEDELGAAGARALRLPGQDGPEDTLFGMPAGRGGASAAGGGAAGPSRRSTYAPQGADVGEEEEEDSFDEEARRSGFRLHGAGDEMETLHGGKLLESVPFQDSPLAKWRP
ncbi:hypothetical protein JCM3775_003113 [Rhodotorula graminis]